MYLAPRASAWRPPGPPRPPRGRALAREPPPRAGRGGERQLGAGPAGGDSWGSRYSPRRFDRLVGEGGGARGAREGGTGGGPPLAGRGRGEKNLRARGEGAVAVPRRRQGRGPCASAWQAEPRRPRESLSRRASRRGARRLARWPPAAGAGRARRGAAALSKTKKQNPSHRPCVIFLDLGPKKLYRARSNISELNPAPYRHGGGAGRFSREKKKADIELAAISRS